MNTDFKKEYLKIIEEENNKTLITQSTFGLEQAFSFLITDGTSILGEQPTNVISTVDNNINTVIGKLNILKSPIDSVKQKGKELSPYIQQGLAPLKNGGNIQQALTDCSTKIGKKTNGNIYTSFQQTLDNQGIKVDLKSFINPISESKQIDKIINESVKIFSKELKQLIIEDAKKDITPNMWFNKNAKPENQKPIIFEDSILSFKLQNNKLICEEIQNNKNNIILETLDITYLNAAIPLLPTNIQREFASLHSNEDKLQRLTNIMDGTRSGISKDTYEKLYKALGRQGIAKFGGTEKAIQIIGQQRYNDRLSLTNGGKPYKISQTGEILWSKDARKSDFAMSQVQANSVTQQNQTVQVSQNNETSSNLAIKRKNYKDRVRAIRQRKNPFYRMKNAVSNTRFGTVFNTRYAYKNPIMKFLAWIFDLICTIISLILQLIIFAILVLLVTIGKIISLGKLGGDYKKLWLMAKNLSTNAFTAGLIKFLCMCGIYQIIKYIISYAFSAKQVIEPQIARQNEKQKIQLDNDLPGFILI